MWTLCYRWFLVASFTIKINTARHYVITKYSRDIVSKKFKNIIFLAKDNKKKWKLEKKF